MDAERSAGYAMREMPDALVSLPTLDELDVDNRRVLLRVDFNVPLREGTIRDDSRIRASLPTIRELLDRDARLVLCSHLGRPKGRIDPGLSLEPVAARLAELLDRDVRLPDEVVGDGVTKLVNETRAGEIVLLENLRFHPGETQNDPVFARALADLCDAYVNDAFGASHRAHASVVGVPSLVSARAAGRLLAAEVTALSRLVDAPEHPFVAIVGGAKVSDKLGVLVALVERLSPGDAIVIGGAMANTFLAAAGRDLGGSLQEPEQHGACRMVEEKARAHQVGLVLPSDVSVATTNEARKSDVMDLAHASLRPDQKALDIGPNSARRFAEIIGGAKMVFWNGPMGFYENPTFAGGTRTIAAAVAKCSGFTVVGGGDSLAAIADLGVASDIDHLSTGGGASLEMVEGRLLPGLAALGPEGTN